MKKWLGSIVVLLALLVPIPVMAIGVIPYHVNVDVYANSYAELTFNITGASIVDVSLEDIPLTVEPSHISVVDGKIKVKILGSYTVPSNTYDGYLLLLESGKQVGAGVKINLEVNHINPLVGGGGGGVGGLDVSTTNPKRPSPYVPPVTNSSPSTVPNYPTYDGTNNSNPPQIPLQSTSSFSPFALVIVAGVVLLIFGIYYYNKKKQQG